MYTPIYIGPRASFPAFLLSSFPSSLLPFLFLTFIEQNFGPHMEQKWAFLPASESMVSSW